MSEKEDEEMVRKQGDSPEGEKLVHAGVGMEELAGKDHTLLPNEVAQGEKSVELGKAGDVPAAVVPVAPEADEVAAEVNEKEEGSVFVAVTLSPPRQPQEPDITEGNINGVDMDENGKNVEDEEDDDDEDEDDDEDDDDEMMHTIEPGDIESGGVVDMNEDEEKENEKGEGELKNEVNVVGAMRVSVAQENGGKEEVLLGQVAAVGKYPVKTEGSNQSFPIEYDMEDGYNTGTEDEQSAFMKGLEEFHREKCLDFKPPKFYGEGLNCLKLWRCVTKLGGYDRVTACKLWRQVGESFKPPKTCTTVSWSFRIFYEKSLLEYERHKVRSGELNIPDASFVDPSEPPLSISHASGSGRARRDAAARAMQGWHSQRLLGNGEVGDPIIKDKHSISSSKREKQVKSVGLVKRKKPMGMERAVKAARTITKPSKPQVDTMVADVGPAADWVKINVRRTKDCFEVYALVPGLLREEVRVQSDPAGRLVISGDPEQPDNPWGVTPFKKVISLPSRIDPHQTSAVVTLHGQLFVRVPFEQSDL